MNVSISKIGRSGPCRNHLFFATIDSGGEHWRVMFILSVLKNTQAPMKAWCRRFASPALTVQNLCGCCIAKNVRSCGIACLFISWWLQHNNCYYYWFTTCEVVAYSRSILLLHDISTGVMVLNKTADLTHLPFLWFLDQPPAANNFFSACSAPCNTIFSTTTYLACFSCLHHSQHAPFFTLMVVGIIPPGSTRTPQLGIFYDCFLPVPVKTLPISSQDSHSIR